MTLIKSMTLDRCIETIVNWANLTWFNLITKIICTRCGCMPLINGLKVKSDDDDHDDD